MSFWQIILKKNKRKTSEANNKVPIWCAFYITNIIHIAIYTESKYILNNKCIVYIRCDIKDKRWIYIFEKKKKK